MGGYSSFPVCLASKILGIPFIIYENNLFIGKSNKYLLPFASKILVSYPALEGVKAKYKNKVAVIGNIIREEILYSNIDYNPSNENLLNILILGEVRLQRYLERSCLKFLSLAFQAVLILKYINSVSLHRIKNLMNFISL